MLTGQHLVSVVETRVTSPGLFFVQVKVIISDYKVGNASEAGARATGVCAHGAAEPAAGTCWGAHSWGEDAVCVLGWGFGF